MDGGMVGYGMVDGDQLQLFREINKYTYTQLNQASEVDRATRFVGNGKYMQ